MLRTTTSIPSKVCFVVLSLGLLSCSTQAEPSMSEEPPQMSEEPPQKSVAVQESVEVVEAVEAVEKADAAPEAATSTKTADTSTKAAKKPRYSSRKKVSKKQRILVEQREQIQVQQKKVEKLGNDLDQLRRQLVRSKLKKYRRIALDKGWKTDVEPASDKPLWRAWVKLEKQSREGVK